MSGILERIESKLDQLLAACASGSAPTIEQAVTADSAIPPVPTAPIQEPATPVSYTHLTLPTKRIV